MIENTNFSYFICTDIYFECNLCPSTEMVAVSGCYCCEGYRRDAFTYTRSKRPKFN